MYFSLKNQRNNAIVNANRALASYLKVQLPKPTIVDGRMRNYTPPYAWTGKSLAEIEANGGNPDEQMNAPVPEWAPGEKSPRRIGANREGLAAPTSTALNAIMYDAKNNIVHYNFRGGGKTYHSFMSNDLFNRWITSDSIGRFWQQHLRTPGKGPLTRTLGDGRTISSFVLPSAGSPTDGMPTESEAAEYNQRPVVQNRSVAGKGTSLLTGLKTGGVNIPALPRITFWDAVRMLMEKGR